MKKRHMQQQIVESDPSWAPLYSPRSHEVGSVRLTLLVGVTLVGLLILASAILGIMSLSDLFRGHSGETWHHLLAGLDAIKGWLIAGGIVAVGIKVALPLLEMTQQTALPRAQAAKVREEARRLKRETEFLEDLHQHNLENLPATFISFSDHLGNFPTMVGPDGRPVGMLLPGNAPTGNSGINPKILLDFMRQQQQQTTVEADEENEVPLRIEGPKKIKLSDQIEEGLTVTDEEASVFGYPIDTYEPFQAPLFLKEGNFVNSLFVIGDQGQGKSTIGTYFAALTVNHGGHLLVIDPDAGEDQSISTRLGPLKDFLLCEVANTPEKAKRLLTLAENEIEQPGEYPLLLLVDEFSMIMRQKKMGGKWQDVADLCASTVENYATRGRKRRRRAIVFGQISNASRTGGTELRDSCAFLIFNTPYKKAALILQDASDEEIAELAPSLTPGIAIVSPAKSSETYVMQFTFPDERGLQIIADVRAESEEYEGSGSQFQDEGEAFRETETEDLKSTRNLPENIREITPETAWKAKVRRVREMRAKNRSQKEILYAVWGVLPGGSTEYAKAREEYQQMIAQFNSSEEIG